MLHFLVVVSLYAHFKCLCVNSLYSLGNLSSAVLDGMISSSHDPPEHFSASTQTPKVVSSLSEPNLVPRNFVACVHSQGSAVSLKKRYDSADVTILARENVRGVKQADLVILGVEPSVVGEVLAEPGMRDALTNKILVSFVGGANVRMLQEAIYGQDSPSKLESDAPKRCQIIRVIPSTAAAVRGSFTLVIEEKGHPYPPQLLNKITSLFLRVGSVRKIPDSIGHVGATLGASSPAFFALVLEGAVDGAVELGMDRAAALEMAAAAMRGAADLVAHGEGPEDVRRGIATPGGSTAVGLNLLEKAGAKQSMQQAIATTARRVGGLGQKKVES